MQVEINSVWDVSNIDGLSDGLYRLLASYKEDGVLILFDLAESISLKKPISVDFEVFLSGVEKKDIKPSSFTLPFYLLLSDGDIPSEYIKRRDDQFELIEGLVNKPYFLFEVAVIQRCKIIPAHAKSKGTYVQKLYRILNQYWRYGQDVNGLLPAYKNSGGPGEPRLAGLKKRGAPMQLSTPGMITASGKNATEEDKQKFLKAIKKYALKGRSMAISHIYKKMLNEFYADEILQAEKDARSPLVPSLRSFRYWVKKLIPESEFIKKSTSSGDFDRNKRGLRGSTTDHAEVPGSYFELDATVLDVHIVSEFNRNHVIGRPTLYYVIDKVSRMIVGLHVSMEYASWKAGRQALVNSFSSKKYFCARYGIEIEDEDWPCRHIPQRLLCDRGEFICKDAEERAVPLIGHLSFAPPYRAEKKGVVEHRFHILNENLIHDLMGTTRGTNYIRGDKDPRMDAVFTLKEVTQMIIEDVLVQNSKALDALASQTTLLIESQLSPTPLNYWNVYLNKHLHALSKADEAEIRAKLLPVEYVSMTSKGIRLNDDMYYECDRPEFEDWKTIARNYGRSKMEALIDSDNSSFIFVRLQPLEGFTRCKLMKRSSIFEERHKADVLYFKDWKKLEQGKPQVSTRTVEAHARRKSIVEAAKQEVNELPKLGKKSDKIKGMKDRRREYVSNARVEEKIDHDDYLTSADDSISRISEERKEKVISILKRKKDSDK
ncbi:transposase [Oceanimonas pelagia]|uniref:Transposase n=1 Tax=Oceanimonas pelagia TaxID=3028314 RepID=A0AA50QA51_9GAMM|nr:transposase [Oceanimonas pelagia]WMC10658.1 transposase [Oceanimonas pelagia]